MLFCIYFFVKFAFFAYRDTTALFDEFKLLFMFLIDLPFCTLLLVARTFCLLKKKIYLKKLY